MRHLKPSDSQSGLQRWDFPVYPDSHPARKRRKGSYSTSPAHVGGMDEITDQDRQFTAGFLQWTGMNKEDGFKYEASERFHIDPDKCIECSTCQGVCPRGNYEYGSQGLTVSGQCDYCLAYIHACPQKAISFKPSDKWLLGPERNPDARYRNPNISLNDIINSNRQ